jgi:HK97 family phage major capsid protein
MNLFEMKKQRAHALNKADSILKLAEDAKRELTVSEQQDVDVCMTTSRALTPQIQQIESVNTLTPLFNRLGGVALLSQEKTGGSPRLLKGPGRILSHDYVEAFFSYVASKGTQVSAALYEGSDGAGGYAVPIVVSDQIVALSAPDMGARKLASVIPTVADIKIPQKGSFGVAGAKLEGDGTGTHLFPETDPTLTQITLSAFMSGIQEKLSWELCQDVSAFQQFAVDDMLTAQQIYEESKYVSGSGTGEPQGLLGNTGTGVTAAVADAQGNLLSLDATFEVMGYLKGLYRANAAWLMQWATGIALRKAQRQANLFEPVFTSVAGKDFLHGFPIEYSTSMPAIAAGNTPVLFGDFKRGFVIGDRGGSGINVKVLDQPLATEGLIVLLAYRRSDSRVRRSEAIQAITLHASS